MQAARTIEPLFDSPRKALHFALNHRAKMARPVMNKMAAGNSNLQQLVLADGSKITVSRVSRFKAKRLEQLQGMDGVAQAGMVLFHLARLPEPQQLVLIAQSIAPWLPCACRAPCCSGHKPNPPWVHAILVLCDYLRDEAKLSKIKGKKGLSTSPYLRRSLVERFLQPSRAVTLAQLATRCDVTEQTVAAHNKPISAYLMKAENEGWYTFDSHLGEAGIVGDMSNAM